MALKSLSHAICNRVGNTPVQVGRRRRPQVVDKFVCVLRARQRTQNTHKLVQKDYLRRSRNVYGGIAPTDREGRPDYTG
ncbi:MAG: hypothetical protein ACJ8DI_06755 [Ktedonobacteraceae bacterium]